MRDIRVAGKPGELPGGKTFQQAAQRMEFGGLLVTLWTGPPGWRALDDFRVVPHGNQRVQRRRGVDIKRRGAEPAQLGLAARGVDIAEV
nr:hypothetical protein [Acerihabitans arboris]